MKIKIFWQPGCPNCPSAKELGKELEQEGHAVEYYNIKEPNGLSEAVFYGLMATPSIVIVDSKNFPVAKFAGVTPSKNEIVAKLK